MKVGDMVALSMKGQRLNMNAFLYPDSCPNGSSLYGLLVKIDRKKMYSVRWFNIVANGGKRGDKTHKGNHYRWELKKFKIKVNKV